jgi:DNA-directed RNA polymerase specialized sigma24 family protein
MGDMEHAAEAKLIAAAQQGDDVAFARLFRRWFDAIFDFAARVTGNEEAALAITEETFTRASESIEAAHTGIGARGWFFAIAWGLMDQEGFLFDEPPPNAGLPDDPERAVACLGPRKHAILDLALRQGLAPAELGRVLRVAPATAETLVGRVRLRAQHAGACGTVPGGAPMIAEYAALPPLIAPDGYAEELLDEIREKWPALVAAPNRPAIRITPPPPPPSLRRAAWTKFAEVAAPLCVAAAMLALALLAPISPVALTRDVGERQVQPAAALSDEPAATATPAFRVATRTPTRVAAPGGGLLPSAAPSATAAGALVTQEQSGTPASATPEPQLPATSTPTRTAPTPRPSTATATPSPTPACVARLSSPVTSVTLTEGEGVFSVTNSFCARAAFTVRVIRGDWLSASPANGALDPGESAAVNLTADPPDEPGTYVAFVQITGPGEPFVVNVIAIRE